MPDASPSPTAAAHLPAALPCVIDVEASGFGAGSYPIEVGFVLPDGSAWCTLVLPDDTWTHWDGRAEQLHGITRPLLARHGRRAAEVADELNRRLAGRRVYTDNWAHDFTWLARLFDCAGCSPRFELHHLNELMDDGAMARFDAARDHVSRTLHLKRHRASSDARVLQMSVARAIGEGR